MQYLALIYGDDSAAPQAGEREAMLERYLAFSREAREAGVVVGADELAPTSAATTVRVRDAQTLVTDGPYAEVKEALGGYYLFECASFDDALDWAARIPGAEHGAIEVRPVYQQAEDETIESAIAAGEGVSS